MIKTNFFLFYKSDLKVFGDLGYGYFSKNVFKPRKLEKFFFKHETRPSRFHERSIEMYICTIHKGVLFIENVYIMKPFNLKFGI